MQIKNNDDLKKVFEKNKRPIFGASVYAFERLGPENFIKNYKLLSLYDSKETDLIKKNIPVFCLEEKTGGRVSPRNVSSLLCHSETKKYLRKKSGGKKPLILIYKSSKRIAQEKKKNNWDIAVAPSYFGKSLLENKANFRRILNEIKVDMPPGRIVPISFFKHRRLGELKKEFGFPFVMQHPAKGGGKGTFFIKDQKAFSTAKQYLRRQKADEVVIARLIKGPSPSVVGCVTRQGVLSTRLQHQICDEPLLNVKARRGGLFCGNDWSASNFPKEILDQAKDAVDKIGNYFKKIKYKGIFGIDFILDKKTGKLYVVECNPRLTAALPTLTLVQNENGEMPIIAFHLLEYLNASYKIDVEKVNAKMWQKKEGAQIFLHNPLKKRAIQKKEFEAGVYKKKGKNGKVSLGFVKKTYQFSDLKDKNEFLLTDGIQKKGVLFKGYQRIRILSKKSLLAKDFCGVNKETKELVKVLRRFVGKSLKAIKK